MLQGSLEVDETVAIDLPLTDCLVSAVAIGGHTSSVRSGFELLGLTSEERVQINSLAIHSLAIHSRLRS